jgi:hypothetical protein
MIGLKLLRQVQLLLVLAFYKNLTFHISYSYLVRKLVPEFTIRYISWLHFTGRSLMICGSESGFG